MNGMLVTTLSPDRLRISYEWISYSFVGGLEHLNVRMSLESYVEILLSQITVRIIF
jgi:hypothetical protein